MSSALEKTLSLLVLFIFNVNADKVILTNSGPVKGVTVSDGDLTIEAFLGIPFAEPPIGELRFRNPLPKTLWQDVYKADSLPPSCMQKNSGHYYEPSLDTPMSEDCLYLNLWVPYQKSDVTEPLKTIMIFIHGGAFNIGSSNQKLYDGTNLAKKGDVIVASFNYRIGAFGFIYPNIEGADYNMGTFDQMLAMKWIKDNARAFGGDPDSIVLFGESAGSMTIGAFLYSPMTRDLFKRGIMQSGSSTIPFTLLNNTGLFKMSQRLASFAGCADGSNRSLTSDPLGVMACLKGLPAETITEAEAQLKKILPLTFYPSTGGEFSEVAPVEYLKRGDFKDTELLIGHNEAEGPFFLTAGSSDYFGEHGSNKIKISSKRFARNLIRTALNVVGIGGQEAKELAKNYTDPIDNGDQDALLDAMGDSIGDYLITCGTYFHAEFTSLKSPVYYYVLKRRASSSPLGEWMKTTHFDELQYVFGNPLFGDFTPEEAAFSDKVMRRWLAFAKTGNPNIPGEVEWPKFHLNDQKYLEMSDLDAVRSGRPENGRCEAWRAKHQAFIDDDVLKNFTGH